MKITSSKKQLREFGLLIGLGIPIMIGFIIPFISGHNYRIWTVWVGIPFLLFAFLSPRKLFYPYKAWMMLGFVLGWVNSKLILGLVFLLVLQPIALLMRLTGYDPLKKRRKGKNTYREKRHHHRTDLTRIF